MARHNLGSAKFGMGDKLGGLNEIQAAADIYATLAKIHPGAYLPAYAHILGSLVRAFAMNDRNPEAIAQAEACVGVYRDLNKQAPGRFKKQLISSLEDLKSLYEDTGNVDRAQSVGAELTQLT
jgi:hypothetical protein